MFGLLLFYLLVYYNKTGTLPEQKNAQKTYPKRSRAPSKQYSTQWKSNPKFGVNVLMYKRVAFLCPLSAHVIRHQVHSHENPPHNPNANGEVKQHPLTQSFGLTFHDMLMVWPNTGPGLPRQNLITML